MVYPRSVLTSDVAAMPPSEAEGHFSIYWEE
jgi:hypothetical protein